MLVNVKTDTEVEVPDGTPAVKAQATAEAVVSVALASIDHVRLVRVTRTDVLYEAA